MFAVRRLTTINDYMANQTGSIFFKHEKFVLKKRKQTKF